MGAALGVLLGAVGTAIATGAAAAASAAAIAATDLGLALGFLILDGGIYAEFIGGAAAGLIGPFIVSEVTVELTALGAAVIGIATTATVLGIAGGIISSAIASRPKIAAQPTVQAILAGKSSYCSPKYILDHGANGMRCWDPWRQALRVEHRKKGYRPLSPAEETSVHQGPVQYRKRAKYGSAKGRKMDAAPKRMRSKSVK